MGLVDLKTSSAVMMIRREMISWLRPVEALEQVVLSGGDGVTTEIFSDIPPLAGNSDRQIEFLANFGLRPINTVHNSVAGSEPDKDDPEWWEL